MSKREMLTTLLDTFKWALDTGSNEPLLKWLDRVGFALDGARMDRELEIWEKAITGTRFSIDEGGGFDPTLVLHVETMRGILQSFLANIEEIEPAGELFPIEIVDLGDKKRPYIEKLAIQANGCYRNGWYDGCAVMIRRLIENMIIDCFINYNLEAKIKVASGNDRNLQLQDLIDLFLAETAWHIPPLTRKYLSHLKSLKDMGDGAAHGRNITPPQIIENLKIPISHTFQTLVDIAYFQTPKSL